MPLVAHYKYYWYIISGLGFVREPGGGRQVNMWGMGNDQTRPRKGDATHTTNDGYNIVLIGAHYTHLAIQNQMLI